MYDYIEKKEKKNGPKKEKCSILQSVGLTHHQWLCTNYRVCISIRKSVWHSCTSCSRNQCDTEKFTFILQFCVLLLFMFAVMLLAAPTVAMVSSAIPNKCTVVQHFSEFSIGTVLSATSWLPFLSQVQVACCRCDGTFRVDS